MNRTFIWKIRRPPWLFNSQTWRKYCPYALETQPNQVGVMNMGPCCPMRCLMSYCPSLEILNSFWTRGLPFQRAWSLTNYAAGPICEGTHQPQAPSAGRRKLANRPPVAGVFDGAEGWQQSCHPLARREPAQKLQGHSHEYVLGKKWPGALIQDVWT